MLRRAQIILASARGEQVGVIAPRGGLSGQAVRNIIRAFHARDLAILQPGSRRNRVIYRSCDTAAAEALRALLHQSPRLCDQPPGVWTLDWAAEVAPERGLTAWRVSGATIRATLARRGVRWRRATEGITSPAPEDARKKAKRERLLRRAQTPPEWLRGFADEVWWRRLVQPALFAWPEHTQPLRLGAQTVARDDPDPKALACYGLLTRCWDTAHLRSEEMGLRFVDGRPVSAVPSDVLTWWAARAPERGKRAVLLIWDNASWQDSQSVRRWVRQHNQQVKQAGHGARLLTGYVPTKSPWLNPIEPQWLAGKKRVADPARLRSPSEREERVCAAFGCDREPHLLQPHSATPTSKKAA